MDDFKRIRELAAYIKAIHEKSATKPYLTDEAYRAAAAKLDDDFQTFMAKVMGRVT